MALGTMKQPRSDAFAFWFGDSDVSEYRTSAERRFLEALYPYANGKWAADAWLHEDHLAISVVLLDATKKLVRRTLRVDFYGAEIWMGDDDTHQMAYPLKQSGTGVASIAAESPEFLAEASAEWINRRLAEDGAHSRAQQAPAADAGNPRG